MGYPQFTSFDLMDHSVSNHRNQPCHHFSPTRTADRHFRTSPLASRLVADLGRIEFVILRTDPSSPVALHLVSPQRNYIRLRGRRGSTPVSPFTLTIKRAPGRTSPWRKPGVKDVVEIQPRRGGRKPRCQHPFCRRSAAGNKRKSNPRLAPWATILSPLRGLRPRSERGG